MATPCTYVSKQLGIGKTKSYLTMAVYVAESVIRVSPRGRIPAVITNSPANVTTVNRPAEHVVLGRCVRGKP